jgi:hypothetical protein
MIEIWKDIPGYEELYAVSSYARVKAYAKTRIMPNGGIKVYPERIRKPGIHYRGCFIVDLWKDGKQKTHKVHRLVAEAFLLNPDNLPCVCHKDDNPANNNVENLFWGTMKDNMDDCQRKGRHFRPKRPVAQYSKDGVLIAEYESTCEAERQTGVCQTNIAQCCGGKKHYKSAGGFKWSYAD